MDRSDNFGFYLPSSNDDDVAEVDRISDNFRAIDEKLAVDDRFSQLSERPVQNKVISEFLQSVSEQLSSIEKSIPVVDSALDFSSENPVQNKVISNKFSEVGQVSANVKDELDREIKPRIEELERKKPEGAVLYTEQTLTEEQKAQARKNIGVDKALLLSDNRTLVVTSNNLYNKATVESGGYYQYTNGAWIERSDMCSTGFISCRAGEKFYSFLGSTGISYGGHLTCYDEEHNFVVGANITQTSGSSIQPITIPDNENIRYFKRSFPSWIYSNGTYQINKDEIKPYDEYAEGYVGQVGYNADFDVIAPNITKIEQEIEEIKSGGLGDKVVSYYTQTYNNDVSIQHKRSVAYGTTFWTFVVNRTKFDGTRVKPRLVGTDDTNPLGGTATTNVSSFALKGDFLHVVNGGIFLTSPNEADGITIIDGNILKSTGVEQFAVEQYVLGIDANGNFKTYRNETAENILADGSIHAVTAFVPLIEGGEVVDDSVLAVCPHYNVKHPRQVIGKLKGGNYFTFACDGRTDGEAGMTLAEVIDTITTEFAVEFAFNLDGGGSTQSTVGKKLVNRMLDNRVVPNVIVFE